MSRAQTVVTPPAAGAPALPPGYLEQSELPLASLVFLLPLVVVYEVGTRYFTTAALHGRDQQIIAFTLMEEFFRLFGATGRHLPAMAVVGILLTWHIARNDPWRVDLTAVFLMGVESVALSLPLIMLGFALSRYFPLAATHRTGDFLIMSFGAGVYEELVFRLALFTFFSLILIDGFGLPPHRAHLFVVLLSGVLFSAYHYLSPAEHFQWRTFTFRTVAGIYFGALFLLRGFGVTAGSHAAYDMMILLF